MEDLMGFWISKQIQVMEHLQKQSERFIDVAPEGSLKIRVRNGKKELRKVTQQPRRERSITNNPLAISQLLQKEISAEAIRRCQYNIKQLRQLHNKYLPIDTMAIKEAIPQSHSYLLKSHQAIMHNHWAKQKYDKREDTYRQAIHTTRKSELVASKSEVIIANGLFENDIPYHYDERSDITNEWNNCYYPDFTIMLPNGERIYWEHFGMLSDWEYLQRAMKKLSNYHAEGITIGRNLIITVDDTDGNCDSVAIYNIIQYILSPHFK